MLAGDDFHKLPGVALKTAHAMFKAAIAAAAVDGLEAAVAAARDAAARIAAAATAAARDADASAAARDADAATAARDADAAVATAVATREKEVDALLVAWQKKIVPVHQAVLLLIPLNTVLSAVFGQLLEKKKVKSADSVIEFLLADALRQCQLVWNPFKPSTEFEHRQDLKVLFQSQRKLLAIPKVWERVFGRRPPVATVSEEQIACGKASSATWELFSNVTSYSCCSAVADLDNRRC